MKTTMMSNRNYTELSRLKSFKERFEYLKIGGVIGETTFGFDRYLNQDFYRSKEWRSIRNKVIVRDEASDLGIEDYPIPKKIIIHHMNPISEDDIENRLDYILDPEFLICVSPTTHNAIHFGDESLLPSLPVERYSNDMCPWRI